MNERQLREAIAYLAQCMRNMVTRADGAALEGEHATQFEEGRTAIEGYQTQIDAIEAQRTALEGLPAEPATPPTPANPERGRPTPGDTANDDLYSMAGIQSLGRARTAVASDLRAKALTAIEKTRCFVEDDHAEQLTRKLERFDGHGYVAERVLATLNPHYRTAFAKLLAGTEIDLDAEERAAIRTMRAVQSGSNADGGFAVPSHLDPTLILTNDGRVNPWRALANVVTLSVGTTWNGVSSAGVSAGFGAELSVQGDDAPTFAAAGGIPVERADAFVPYSIESEQDIDGLADMLIRLLVDAKDELEAVAYTTGTGVSPQPTGIITGLVAANRIVASASTDTFALADLYALLEGVPPRHRDAAISDVVFSLEMINAMRQFGTANNYHGFLTDLTADSPRTLIGRRLHECSKLDSTINATQNNYIGVQGNISDAFAIVDKMGMNLERVANVPDPATGRPMGKRGLSAIWRTGSGLTNSNAARVLNIT